jgi:hypothetical protein
MNQVALCPRCFSAAVPQANFCRRCGLELDSLPVAQPSRRKRPWMIFWAGPLFVFAFAGFFGVHNSIQRPMVRTPETPRVDPNFFQPVRVPVYQQQIPDGVVIQRWPLPPDHDKMDRRSGP